MFRWARSYNIKILSGSWGIQENVRPASICLGAQGLCTASGEGRMLMLNDSRVKSLKSSKSRLKLKYTKQSSVSKQIHLIHLLCLNSLIYLDEVLFSSSQACLARGLILLPTGYAWDGFAQRTSLNLSNSNLKGV